MLPVYLLLVSLLPYLGWRIVKADRGLSAPRWLGWLLLGAAILRLAAGVFWFVALPVWGYDSPVENAGYVMSDAYTRDRAAWELARSEAPLWKAFTGQRMGDQYGGMLFLSATIYRYLGGENHQPLLIVVLTASISALAVLFTWAFVRRIWGEGAARLAAWILAIYPEAVLLGSSQMREAFILSWVMIAFYGLARYWQERSWVGLGCVIGATLICLPFSPPATGLLVGLLVVQAISLSGWQILRQPRLWLALAGVALLAMVGVWLAWSRIAPEGISNPFALIGWWLTQTARWQAYFAKRASDLIRKTFKQTPVWTHIFILMGYGVLQPFLPGALLEGGAPIWRGIAIWRALGWTLLLPFLVYALWRAWGKAGRGGMAGGLSLVVWLGILLPALRSGGDQWDNPRYRAAFAGLQAALAAWVWFEHRRQPDPWLARVLIGIGIVLAWFVPWYLHRYTGLAWPVTDLFKTIGLGVVSAGLYFVWDWARRNKV